MATLHPDSEPPPVRPKPKGQPTAQAPLQTTWPRLKKKVNEERLNEEMKDRFGYYSHDWQMRAAPKVLEGNDGIVIAGTGKGKTLIFALISIAAELSESNGHYIVISPLKALEGNRVSIRFLLWRLGLVD